MRKFFHSIILNCKFIYYYLCNPRYRYATKLWTEGAATTDFNEAQSESMKVELIPVIEVSYPFMDLVTEEKNPEWKYPDEWIKIYNESYKRAGFQERGLFL